MKGIENLSEENIWQKIKMNKLLCLGIVAVIAAVLGATIFFISGEQKKDRRNLPKNVTLIETKNPDELPSEFPKIPLNGSKKMLSSYTLLYKGQEQDQKVANFISSKTVNDNFVFYKDWAVKNDWKIVYGSNDNNEAKLIFEKNNKTFHIVVRPASDANESQINMSW